MIMMEKVGRWIPNIKRLREKLGDAADCIKTVIKAGYRLEG